MLVLSGPHLDRLGKREPEIYGKTTLPEIHDQLAVAADARDASVDCRQSNYEGEPDLKYCVAMYCRAKPAPVNR